MPSIVKNLFVFKIFFFTFLHKWSREHFEMSKVSKQFSLVEQCDKYDEYDKYDKEDRYDIVWKSFCQVGLSAER